MDIASRMGFGERAVTEALSRFGGDYVSAVCHLVDSGARTGVGPPSDSLSRGITLARCACIADQHAGLSPVGATSARFTVALPLYKIASSDLLQSLQLRLTSDTRSQLLQYVGEISSRVEQLSKELQIFQSNNSAAMDSASSLYPATPSSSASSSSFSPLPASGRQGNTHSDYAASLLVRAWKPTRYLDFSDIAIALLLGMHEALDESKKGFAPSVVDNSAEANRRNVFPHEPYYRFIDHAPNLFRSIRDLTSLSDDEYRHSFEGPLKVMSASGKSGCYFYMSPDSKYILKSVYASEFQFFLRILPDYFRHLKANPNTLLVRFYSLYTVRYMEVVERTERGERLQEKEIYFVVMNNICPPGVEVMEQYDLKGSTLGRQATAEERKKKSVMLKDLDWKRTLGITSDMKEFLLLQMSKDCAFLRDNSIMDYSLLLFITKCDPRAVLPSFGRDISLQNNELQATDEHGRPLAERYYLGIIDILQEYNLRKKVENKLKSLAWHEDDVSCQDPVRYSMRFETFMMRVINGMPVQPT